MLFISKVIGAYTGSVVNLLGYSSFFMITAVMGILVIVLILWLKQIFKNQ